VKKTTRRKIAGLAAFLALFTSYLENEIELDYKLLDRSKAFASYSGGYVYIGDRTIRPSIDLEEGDVFVIDSRYDDEPDMKICDSYLVRSKKQRREILEILCLYEECYPSQWNRTLESMELEWTIHNLSYDLNYERNSSTDVDLDNKDEDKYSNKILQKLLK